MGEDIKRRDIFNVCIIIGMALVCMIIIIWAAILLGKFYNEIP